MGGCIDLIFTNRKHSLIHSKLFKTGLNDHHHIIYTILKATFTKLPPKEIPYRGYKNCSQLHLKDDLKRNIASAHPSTYRNFESIFMKTLEANAPTKAKKARSNNKPHMNKTITEEIDFKENFKQSQAGR